MLSLPVFASTCGRLPSRRGGRGEGSGPEGGVVLPAWNDLPVMVGSLAASEPVILLGLAGVIGLLLPGVGLTSLLPGAPQPALLRFVGSFAISAAVCILAGLPEGTWGSSSMPCISASDQGGLNLVS